MTVQYENQKKDLANWMATMRDKKKQTMTLRLREKEQMRTATMVKKQSEQMLHLIAQKQQELKRELETELQREKMETMVRPDADSPNRQLENNNHITTVVSPMTIFSWHSVCCLHPLVPEIPRITAWFVFRFPIGHWLTVHIYPI